MTELPYFESYAPGAGRRAPRADFISDAKRLSLNGRWQFMLSPTAAGSGLSFMESGFDASAWADIRVPAHWVLEPLPAYTNGLRPIEDFSPLYTNTAFPIPIDPPRVPTENATGDYRLEFDLPTEWHTPGTVLRFQGVDSCGMVWLNGIELGHSKGSRLPFEFDIGHLLRGKSNVLAVRVHRWSSGTYLEDQDMWWLPGIFRDVELIERPDAAVDDYFIHAKYDHLMHTGTLRIDATAPGTVSLPELGIKTRTGVEVTVPVEPWSAELPRLYRGTLDTTGESIELAVGFRTVTIEDGRLLVNGAPVLFRGVNRHEHDPDRGRSLDPETMRRDVVMMKQHNINAVRTSHYPPHPEFLRLCDEYGLWVVEECDIETHGFIYAGWEGNPVAEPAWRDALQDRVERMVERDKNHPSIVVWSMANESWVGDTFGDLEHWIRERDPDRPIMYERDPSYQNSDFYSLMYPSQAELERIGRREEKKPEGLSDEQDKRRRGLPFLLCEYAHAMGNGPGSLADYQHILESHERFCGAFVWEWIDHGFRDSDANGAEYFRHGGDIDYRPNGGRFCLDGLVFPDRTPSPGLLEYKKAIEPVSIELGDEISVRNKHDYRDLSHLSFTWKLETDGVEVASGTLDVPGCEPRSTVTLPLPVLPVVVEGEMWITVMARLARDELWGSAGHEVAWGQSSWGHSHVGIGSHRPPRFRSSSAQTTGIETPPGLTLGPATFDDRTGRLIRLGDLKLDGPVLDVWRAPIENDRGQGGRNNLAATWKAVGVDRMLHRVDSITFEGSQELVVVGRTAPATQAIALRTIFTWQLGNDDSLGLRVQVTPDGPWNDTPFGHHNVTLPRLGLRMSLPGNFCEAQWFGRGPGESYIDSQASARVGRFHSTIDSLQVNYPVPEENGNHVQTRWLSLSGSDLPTLRVDGAPYFDFTARRWTSEALEIARHPQDLRDSGRVWLNLDFGQQGLGSASCGPALPERFRLQPALESFTLALVFSSGW